MGQLVQPSTYLIGFSEVYRPGLIDYLTYTGQTDFLESFDSAVANGLSSGEALCSFYAKLCYKSLVLGKNANVTRVRDIPANIANAIDMGHGSVLEHVNLNFVITNCSRVLSHELVRHRIGTAFSQTSGRYCRLDNIDLVWDPILEGCEDLVSAYLKLTEDTVYLMECKKNLRIPPDLPENDRITPEFCLECRDNGVTDWEKYRWVSNDKLNFDIKKKITSAIRRVAPNGQSNEMGFSLNLRSLRQIVQVRTSSGAEREIRLIFNQIYDLVKDKFPMIFHGARTKMVDGLRMIYGMKCQPYEMEAGNPEALQFFTRDELLIAAAKSE